jgi:hypothetical protein
MVLQWKRSQNPEAHLPRQARNFAPTLKCALGDWECRFLPGDRGSMQGLALRSVDLSRLSQVAEIGFEAFPHCGLLEVTPRVEDARGVWTNRTGVMKSLRRWRRRSRLGEIPRGSRPIVVCRMGGLFLHCNAGLRPPCRPSPPGQRSGSSRRGRRAPEVTICGLLHGPGDNTQCRDYSNGCAPRGGFIVMPCVGFRDKHLPFVSARPPR